MAPCIRLLGPVLCLDPVPSDRDFFFPSPALAGQTR